MHKSVLLKETIEYLNLDVDNIVVDCTLGYAGHSSEILKRINRGFLFAFDQDEDAIKESNIKLQKIGSNYEIIKSNFIYLKEELVKRNVFKVDKILFDLGVSSPQLDEKERGFSFHHDAKLDMRMDKSNPISAYEIVNNYSYEQLVDIFYKYGEEKYATGIAKQIIKRRSIKSIKTTLELVEVIKTGVPEKYKREKHPGRKVFQAIRIEVNNEIETFEGALRQALDLIKVNGRVCVITFHSLEDKICKQIFKEHSSMDNKVSKLPFVPEQYQPKFKIITSVTPSKQEVDENNRSRSAKLRVIEKIRE